MNIFKTIIVFSALLYSTVKGILLELEANQPYCIGNLEADH